MRPLSKTAAPVLIERIDNATGSEIRSITMKDPATFVIRLSVQDRNRGFDWIDIAFEVSGVSDARLVDESKLPFVDMSEGITVVYEGAQCALAVGNSASLTSVSDAVIYLIGTSIKYEELPFSG